MSKLHSTLTTFPKHMFTYISESFVIFAKILEPE